MWLKTASDRSILRNPAALLATLLILSALLLQSYHYINGDVAFMTWAANQILGPPAYGRDILDVNPPLCPLIYMPAALLANLIGFDQAIRVWMLCLSLLSLSVLWLVADKTLRTPLAIVLVMFIMLAYPHHYAQREQIVFVLCAPYVAGWSSRRPVAIASGVMAGIGFLMKPYFIIPLALLILLRRRFAIEERAILAVGIAYAVILILFFQPYLFEMVPAAMATYWAIKYPLTDSAQQAAFILLSTLPLAATGRLSPASRPFLAATLGFTLAAVLQNKGFIYHFIPAFGFLAMFLTVCMLTGRRLIALVAGGFLLAEAALMGKILGYWLYAENVLMVDFNREIQLEIDRSGSFISLHPNPYPAFPAAIYTPSKFMGTAISQLFLPAVRQYTDEKVGGDPSEAFRLALDQAKRELSRGPNLVIASAIDHDGTHFNYLDWLEKDDGFRELWKNYQFYRIIGPLLLYRRVQSPPSG